MENDLILKNNNSKRLTELWTDLKFKKFITKNSPKE